jgi:hypothetical protein
VRPFRGQDSCGDELISAVDSASGSDHTVDATADVTDLPQGHLLLNREAMRLFAHPGCQGMEKCSANFDDMDGWFAAMKRSQGWALPNSESGWWAKQIEALKACIRSKMCISVMYGRTCLAAPNRDT